MRKRIKGGWPMGAGDASQEGIAEGHDDRHRCHDAGSERGAALNCAATRLAKE
jgi:hypothetical protein